MSTDYDAELAGPSSAELKPKMTKQDTVQKSIVNILAEDVIKEPKEPRKNRVSTLSHMTKKTLTRRSNLRHALADEKSKRLLQNEQRTSPVTKSNLHIQKKELSHSVSPVKNAAFVKQPVLPETAMLATGPKEPLESVDSEVYSMRRDSVASHTQPMSPTLTGINQGPEIFIV